MFGNLSIVLASSSTFHSRLRGNSNQLANDDKNEKDGGDCSLYILLGCIDHFLYLFSCRSYNFDQIDTLAYVQGAE